MIVKMIETLKKNLSPDIDDDILLLILFEMSRYFDFQLKDLYNSTQKTFGKKFNTIERKLLRHYFYYGGESILNEVGIDCFNRVTYSDYDKLNVLSSTIDRLTKYEPSKIYKSIEKRYSELNELFVDTKNYKSWLKWHNDKYFNDDKCDLFIFKINQEFFDLNSEKSIYVELQKAFMKLNNYRYLAVIVDGDLYKKGCVVTWQIIYKLSIYLENISQYNDNFFPFKKEKQINTLSNFLLSKNIDEDKSKNIAKSFYSSISSGFKFEDLMVSDDYTKKIITFKKIVLDNTAVPCPSCLKTIESGNSFPEMFLRSWECKNPNCPSRSKSGRGKRFDEFGVYKYFKTINNSDDLISNELYNQFRRDVFPKATNVEEMIIKLYSYTNEIVFTSNIQLSECHSRKIKSINDEKNINFETKLYNDFYDLPIYKTFKLIYNEFSFKTSDYILINDFEVFNSNSTFGIKELKPGQIGSVITSPPYYNAREYSQWENMLLYFIDMMDNANSVFLSLCPNGKYLYNIGDIVSSDNIYVVSNMSKRRQMLGFYSMMIFEIVGFHLSNNIIWDKGEVQSKRNSTVNLYPFYVKCINCYEHIIAFSKEKTNVFSENNIIRLNPVIKINSKGENKYGHTAPYPLELVNTIKQFSFKDKYVLDPFLGSGTTLIWCAQNGYKGVGYELNSEYFKLATNRLSVEKRNK